MWGSIKAAVSRAGKDVSGCNKFTFIALDFLLSTAQRTGLGNGLGMVDLVLDEGGEQTDLWTFLAALLFVVL